MKLTSQDPLFLELFTKIRNGTFSCRRAIHMRDAFTKNYLFRLLERCDCIGGDDLDWKAHWLQKNLGIPYYNTARYLAESL